MKITKQKVNQTSQLIQRYYDSKNVLAIQRLLKRNPIDLINESLQEINDIETTLFILMAVSGTKTSALFRCLPDQMQGDLIRESSNQQLKVILKNLYPDELLDIANGNKQDFKKILLCLTSKQRKLVKEIAHFDNDEAGSIMNPDYIAFNESWSIKDCLAIFRKNYDHIEGNNTFFVTSSNKILLGSVNIQDLIFSENYSASVSSLMDQSIISVYPNDDIENVIDIFQDYNFDTLAVVNDDNQLIGVITDNDILPAIDDETTEDIYHMYGIQKLEESYIKSSVWKIVKSRLFWVVILMISATLTSIVINRFQDLGDTVTAGLSSAVLVPIIPVITGTSGNTGSQAVASVIRALAVGEVTPKEYRRVIWKEFKVGFVLGFILAIVNIARLAIYFAIPAFRPDLSGVHFMHNQHLTITNPYVVAIIASVASSIALWIAVVLSKCLGSVLPLIATKLKIDPTVMSAPLISTTLDVCSTSILFGVGIGILLCIIS
ncbi:magnesium transporter [Ureaplasma ceti]|uniref:Magnesium transporter MgtE n=1 Tax=Ureaplasma ceti TaxID=3119530 RepID=A0ABP9UBH5_9BACT